MDLESKIVLRLNRANGYRQLDLVEAARAMEEDGVILGALRPLHGDTENWDECPEQPGCFDIDVNP
ncbi:MAG TPA: hypothetical protein QGF58_20085 [Myxococcota bacterium]|nr:hypothetical protein [Myxococcota bacterium]